MKKERKKERTKRKERADKGKRKEKERDIRMATKRGKKKEINKKK